jgi:hypothetical protein
MCLTSLAKGNHGSRRSRCSAPGRPHGTSGGGGDNEGEKQAVCVDAIVARFHAMGVALGGLIGRF